MNRTTVNSSIIKSIGYDVSTKVLEIRFWDDSVYEYLNVPIGVRAQMIASDSIGSFFHQNIKQQYETRRIS